MKYLRYLLADLLTAVADWCRDYADRHDTRYASALNPDEGNEL